MYEKPTLERFGTLREMTQAGPTGTTDGVYVCGIPCDSGRSPQPAHPDRS
jgi:hypothetical protein